MSCHREQSAAEKSNTEQPRRKEEEEEEREEEGRRRKKIKLEKLQWEDKGKRSTKEEEVEGRRKRRRKKQKMDVSSRTGGGLEQVYLVGWQWVLYSLSLFLNSVYTGPSPYH